MNCALCGKPAELQQSHIIPKLVSGIMRFKQVIEYEIYRDKTDLVHCLEGKITADRVGE